MRHSRADVIVRGDCMSFRTRSECFRPVPWRRTFALTLLLGILAPAAARADGMIIPFYGVNFGGNSGQELGNAIDAKRYNWGVSLAYMGAGVLGLEADIARSPDFYGRTDVGGSSVLTFSGNLLLGVPIGGQKGVGFRPFGLVGLGVIRSKVDAFSDVLSLDNSKAAFDFGGGAMFFFGNNVGVRGEVRYFRTFSDVAFDIINVDRQGRLDFTRGSVGLILRF
jgi:opacity protein-like surface antigen